MTHTLTQFQFPNGLKLLLQEIHTAPIVSSWIWYGVGSRNEISGKTGLSHWTEHMQFKGTPTHPGREMDHLISRLGGLWNAFTSADWTTYFETLPSNALEIALELEADRMRNSIFATEEVEVERYVILSEREGSENDPLFQLNEAVQLLAFDQHPYRNEVLGDKSDLLALTRDDLYMHYQTYYQPSNATLCIAGDFQTDVVRGLVEKYFGKIQSQPFTPHIPTPEPVLSASQHVELHGPGDATFIQVAYRSPKANSTDFFAYTILDSLLAGPSSLNMFGSGGISNRTSRLYLALVDKEIAVGVYGGLNASIDPSSYTLMITANPDHDPDEIIRYLDAEIESLREELVDEAEIARAVKQAQALFVYGSDNITNQAFWMGYANSFADYDWFTHYVDRLSAVTPENLRRVARQYLSPDQRVVGYYQPNGNGANHG